MTCREIRDDLILGSEPSESALAHATSCPACGVVLADRALLGRELAAQATATRSRGLETNALFEAVAEDVANERGLRAFLRSRPTWQRRTLACASSLPFLVLLVAVSGARHDLELLGAGRFATELLLLGGLAASNVLLALEPLQVPGRPGSRKILVAAAVALVGIASVLLCADPTSWAESTGGPGEAESRCCATGTALALPLALAGWLFSRQITLPRALLLASAAGLSGMLALHVHCPSRDGLHLGFGHVSVVVACWLAVLVGSGLRRAIAPGSPG